MDLEEKKKRVGWHQINGKLVWDADYSHLKINEAYDLVIYGNEAYTTQCEKSHYILVDFTGSFINADFVKKIKEGAKKGEHMNIRTATLGLTGVQLILAKGVTKFAGLSHKTKFFKSDEREAALKWLFS